MRALVMLLVGWLCLGWLAGCGAEPRTYVALMVDNHSTDVGKPDSARLQVYCDGTVIMDSVITNVFTSPYRNAEAFSPFWLAVISGPHRLRVEVTKHALVKDTTLTLDTLSFTAITLLHDIHAADTIACKGEPPSQLILPADTTSKIVISKVPYTAVPYRHRPPAEL